jgi:hypothetical protein
MDRAMLQRHLAQAEQHVEQGQNHILQQETRIAQLDRDGHDTTEARKFLATLRETQAVHVESRERILKS